MSKKKKETQNEIKSTDNSSIKYTGNVKLSIQTKGVTTKTFTLNNMGTNLLFQQLSLFLIGSGQNLYVPKFLAVGTNDNLTLITQNKLNAEIVNSRVGLTNKRLEVLTDSSSNPIGYKSIFTGVQYYSTIGGVQIKEIGLYGDNVNTTLLARIVVPEHLQLEAGQNLIVDWTISIENKTN